MRTPPPRAEFWIMPDLVGSSLAEAEDAIHFVTDGSRGVRTASLDTTGQGRNDPSRADWRVCWQSSAVGDWIGPGSVVSFHVALYGELGMHSTSGGSADAAPATAPARRIHPQSDE